MGGGEVMLFASLWSEVNKIESERRRRWSRSPTLGKVYSRVLVASPSGLDYVVEQSSAV